ncbi:hypothetical protein GCM10009839_46550 [Catenulispora yoronensis]|uniref:TrbL/VirB6 plasmid conjugal transfer protein n=1 Tax=Catenulispora yoronensis TaxID=450799 RepID=A0ABP5G306_9ACTN
MRAEPKSVPLRAGGVGGRGRASARPAARAIAALLAAVAALLILVPAASAQAAPKAAAPLAAALLPAAPAPAPSPSPSGPGIGLGPGAATPTDTVPATGATGGNTSGGNSDPSFWDIPGQIEKAIDDWFASLVTDALNPVLSLLGSTVLSTPDVTTMPRVGAIWTTMALLANSFYVLFVLAGGIIVMTHETLQSRYAMKDILPRLFAGFLVGNASLAILGLIIHLADVLAQGVMGQGLDPKAAGTALAHMITGSILNSGGVFLAILGLVAAVMAVVLLITYLVRVALMVLLAVAAPVALACHALPQTEGLARLWWRAVIGTLAIQLGQSLVLVTALQIFLDPGGQTALGFPTGSGLTDLLVFIMLFFILIKIPFWVGRSVFGRSQLLAMAKGIATYKLMGAAGLRGKRRASSNRPQAGRSAGPTPPGGRSGSGTRPSGPTPSSGSGPRAVPPASSGRPRYVQPGLFPPPPKLPRPQAPREAVELNMPAPARSPVRQTALFDRRGNVTPAAAPPVPPPTQTKPGRVVQPGLFPPPPRTPRPAPAREAIDLNRPAPPRSPNRQYALFDLRGQVTPAAASASSPPPVPTPVSAAKKTAPPKKTGSPARTAAVAAAGSTRTPPPPKRSAAPAPKKTVASAGAAAPPARTSGAAGAAKPVPKKAPAAKPAPAKAASPRAAAPRKPTAQGGTSK